jgi:hypothetical protein
MATDVSQEINGQVLKFRVSQKSVFYANDMWKPQKQETAFLLQVC